MFFCRFTLHFYMDGNKQKKEREKKRKKLTEKKPKKLYIQSKNCHKFFKTHCLASDIVRKDLFNNNTMSNTDFFDFSNNLF